MSSNELDHLLQLQTEFPSLEANDLHQKAINRLRYYIPISGWLPKYNLDNLRGDIIAGLTVATLVIPQSLSYAQALVNVPPILGLFSAFIPQLIYACLGTSKQLSIGPEALISILVGSSIAEFTQWRDTIGASFSNLDSLVLDPYRNVQATALLCLLVGLFTFGLGFCRLGFLDSVFSRALIRGFVLAVAFVVIIDMSPALLGLIPPTDQCLLNLTSSAYSRTLFYNHSIIKLPNPNTLVESGSPFQKLIDTLMILDRTHLLTATLSLISITFLLSVKYYKRRYKSNRWLQLLPEILILVICTSLLAYIFRLDCKGLSILNTIESKLPLHLNISPRPTLSKVKHLILSAILISIIGFVESIAVAKIYASKHQYTISPNRELVAIGASNIISSLFGGFPAYGSLGRSAIADAAGGKSQLAGLVTGLVVLTVSLFFLPLFKFIPKSVCSSIIVTAALSLIQLDEVLFKI